jgi:hypothetical protein
MNRFLFLLDSGAFTVWRQGKVIKLEDYAEFVRRNRHLFRAGAFNLDVIGSDKQSYENWLELRRLGVETIPVHHYGDDDVYLKKYLDNVEYIGLGGMAKLTAKSRIASLDYLWKEFLLVNLDESRCRVHGLGITDDSIMLRYPWYSFDSARAGITANSGSIMLPQFKQNVNYSSLSTVYLSQRRDHILGDYSSYYSLPRRSRDCILEFVKANGYDLCDEWNDENATFDNMTTNWRYRYSWNLEMISRFIQYHRNQKVLFRIYDSLNSSSLLEVSAAYDRPGISRCLVSYANLTSGKALMKSIEGVVGSQNTY